MAIGHIWAASSCKQSDVSSRLQTQLNLCFDAHSHDLPGATADARSRVLDNLQTEMACLC